MGCLLDCLDWVLNRGTCIDVCLSGDVTRSFWLHNIKLFRELKVEEAKIKMGCFSLQVNC